MPDLLGVERGKSVNIAERDNLKLIPVVLKRYFVLVNLKKSCRLNLLLLNVTNSQLLFDVDGFLTR